MYQRRAALRRIKIFMLATSSRTKPSNTLFLHKNVNLHKLTKKVKNYRNLSCASFCHMFWCSHSTIEEKNLPDVSTLYPLQTIPIYSAWLLVSDTLITTIPLVWLSKNTPWSSHSPTCSPLRLDCRLVTDWRRWRLQQATCAQTLQEGGDLSF